jgi:hypothetical protein
MELGGGGKAKENDRKSTILKCITSLQAPLLAVCYNIRGKR